MSRSKVSRDCVTYTPSQDFVLIPVDDLAYFLLLTLGSPIRNLKLERGIASWVY